MANNIKLEIEVDSKGAIRSINGVTNSLDKMGKEGVTSATNMNNAFSSMIGYLGAMGSMKALSIIQQGFTASIQSAIEFENALAEINTLLPKNEKLTKQTTTAFVELSNAYGKDAQTEAKAYYQIVSAGVEGSAKQLDVLSMSNEAAVAGLTDVATAADVLTSVMNAYADSNLTAQDASDKLFVAVREGKTTFGELAGSIGQVAPVANKANLSFGELTGSLAAITKNGISTAEATTGLKAILTAVIKPSQEAAKYAQKLGIDFSVSAIKAKGFAGFLEEVKKATGGTSESVSKLFPNVRALGPVLGIVGGDMSDFKSTLDATTNSMNATSNAAKIMKESTKFKLDQAEQSVKNLGMSLGELLAPQISLVTSYWTNLIKEMIGSNDAAKNSKQTIKELNNVIKEQTAQLEILKQKYKAQTDGSLLSKLFGDPDEVKQQIAATNLAIIEAENQISEIKKAEWQKRVDAEREAADKEIEEFERVWSAEMEGQQAHNEEMNAIREEQNQYIADLKATENEMIVQDREMRLMGEKLENDERFKYLSETLGKEKALRKIYTIEQIKDEKKRREALSKLFLAADKQDIENQKKKAEAQKAIDEASAKAKLDILNATANLATAILGSENKAAFAIQKAAAIASAYVAMNEAMIKAVAISPLTGGEPMRSYAQVAGMMNIGAIVATAIKGFQEGGIVEGSASGDNNYIRANAGEMVLTQRQQAQLFAQANGVQTGGGTTVNVTVQGDFLSEDQTIDKLIENINDAIELRNKQLIVG